mmetsp:Transcript_73981/g.239169  ORF Transcript_73981/g.239169 Transcript_73981/m.239169 type:complete len:342 (-) Transcript_73981:74-1099(-)
MPEAAGELLLKLAVSPLLDDALRLAHHFHGDVCDGLGHLAEDPGRPLGVVLQGLDDVGRKHHETGQLKDVRVVLRLGQASLGLAEGVPEVRQLDQHVVHGGAEFACAAVRQIPRVVAQLPLGVMEVLGQCIRQSADGHHKLQRVQAFGHQRAKVLAVVLGLVRHRVPRLPVVEEEAGDVPQRRLLVAPGEPAAGLRDPCADVVGDVLHHGPHVAHEVQDGLKDRVVPRRVDHGLEEVRGLDERAQVQHRGRVGHARRAGRLLRVVRPWGANFWHAGHHAAARHLAGALQPALCLHERQAVQPGLGSWCGRGTSGSGQGEAQKALAAYMGGAHGGASSRTEE